MVASQVSPLSQRGRHVDVEVLGIECKTRQRHVVFPAQQSADAPDCSLDNIEARAVAEPPDHAFWIGRHQLSVIVGNGPVGVDDDATVEQRAAADRAIQFLVASDDDNLVFLRGFLQGGMPPRLRSIELDWMRANSSSVLPIPAPGGRRQTKVGYPGNHASGNTTI